VSSRDAIVIDSVGHRYGERVALAEVSFAVGRGEIFALLGPNGGGKTTLFRILSTLMLPTTGTVRIFEDDVRERPAAVRRHLGVVFQAPALDERLTVAENLRFHGRCYGLRGRLLESRIDAALESVSLGERRHDLVLTLSGGMRRRIELAKALLHEPPVLVLDEPSTGLDPRARRELRDTLAELRARAGTTVVLTTHLMDEAAAGDRVAILDRGHLVAIGSPATLTAEVGGDVVWISARDPEALATRIGARFDLRVEVVEGRVRLERTRAHEFVTDLIEAFPGEVDSVTLSRPTLEDVFVHHTGHRFE